MSEHLRYDVETTHHEHIFGRVIAQDLAFEINVGDGQYAVTLTQDRTKTGATLHLHGGTIPALIDALREIHELYAEAVGRTTRALEGRAVEG